MSMVPNVLALGRTPDELVQPPACVLHAHRNADPHLPVRKKSVVKNKITGDVEIGPDEPQAPGRKN
jgi:hypothetical protein